MAGTFTKAKRKKKMNKKFAFIFLYHLKKYNQEFVLSVFAYAKWHHLSINYSIYIIAFVNTAGHFVSLQTTCNFILMLEMKENEKDFSKSLVKMLKNWLNV